MGAETQASLTSDSLQISERGRRSLGEILVLAVGGCGANLVSDLALADIDRIEIAAANTDAQSLERSRAKTKLLLGNGLAMGSGANSDPRLGYIAAKESAAEVSGLLEGRRVLFLVAGLGGGTGTGAAPYFVNLAKAREVLSVVAVTLPFSFEGVPKKLIAEEAIRALEVESDVLVTMSNDELTTLAKDMGFVEAFRLGNEAILAVLRRIIAFVETDQAKDPFQSRRERFRHHMNDWIGSKALSRISHARPQRR